MKWALLILAVLTAGGSVAASILFIGRWQIAAIGYGDGASQGLYRIDRWTGEIVQCGSNPTLSLQAKRFVIICPFPPGNQQTSRTSN